MREVLRTNNPVELSWAQAVLEDSGIDCLVFDQHASVMEGSISAIERRVMVSTSHESRARAVLATARAALDPA